MIPNPIRVLLVDDQTLVRQGVRSLLALADGCRAAGGELRLGGASPDTKDLLTALKLDARIECYDEPGQALAEAWD